MQTHTGNKRQPIAQGPRHALPLTPLKWFWMLAAVMCFGIGGMLADIRLRSAYQDKPAIQAITQMGLSWTTLTPAGTVLNRPEIRHPGVDLRFSPQVPLSLHSIELFQTPRPSTRANLNPCP